MFGRDGINNAFILKCDLLKSVKEQFDAEGIEIPFPYRNVVFKNKPDNLAIEPKNQSR